MTWKRDSLYLGRRKKRLVAPKRKKVVPQTQLNAINSVGSRYNSRSASHDDEKTAPGGLCTAGNDEYLGARHVQSTTTWMISWRLSRHGDDCPQIIKLQHEADDFSTSQNRTGCSGRYLTGVLNSVVSLQRCLKKVPEKFSKLNMTRVVFKSRLQRWKTQSQCPSDGHHREGVQVDPSQWKFSIGRRMCDFVHTAQRSVA